MRGQNLLAFIIFGVAWEVHGSCTGVVCVAADASALAQMKSALKINIRVD